MDFTSARRASLSGVLVICSRCADPGREIAITRDGVVELTITACDNCLAKARSELAALEVQFQALLQAGVSREQANEIMIAKIEETEVKA